MLSIPMTQSQFDEKAARLQRDHGIALTGNQGTLSHSGVTASYHFDGQSLEVNVLDKPFIVTAAYCENILRGYLEK